jgi:subtilisin family serine protease
MIGKHQLGWHITMRIALALALALFVALSMSAAQPAGKATATSNTYLPLSDVHNREILVEFDNSRSAKSTSALCAELGVKQVRSLPLSYCTYEIVQVPEREDYHAVLASLKANPLVKTVGPNVIKHTSSTILNDPLLLNSAIDVEQGLVSPYVKNNQWALLSTKTTEAWDYTTGDPNVIVAVLDTGANLSHEDLVNRIWTNPNETPGNGIDDDDNGFIDDVYGWDFYGWDNGTKTGGDNDVNDPSPTQHSHGTSTSSIIGAQGNNGLGIAGVAGGDSPTSGIRLMILRVGTDSDIQLSAEIGAIDYAIAQGADIISMSFGGASGGAPEENAIDRAWNAGLYLVAAAGNGKQGNVDKDGNPLIDLPAGFANCVCVGATTIFSTQTVSPATDVIAETLAGYSKTGPEMEISAPGTHIMAAANAVSLYTDTAEFQFTGTSAATPVVAGLAALLKSYQPALTNQQIRDRINTYSVDLGATGRDEQYGFGRIDMLAALTENIVNPSSKPGDTNGDDVVDASDLNPIVENFGKSTGQAGYAAQIDTNKDGVIDELDLFLVGRKFGS